LLPDLKYDLDITVTSSELDEMTSGFMTDIAVLMELTVTEACIQLEQEHLDYDIVLVGGISHMPNLRLAIEHRLNKVMYLILWPLLTNEQKPLMTNPDVAIAKGACMFQSALHGRLPKSYAVPTSMVDQTELLENVTAVGFGCILYRSERKGSEKISTPTTAS
jgi:hypothetical protein